MGGSVGETGAAVTPAGKVGLGVLIGGSVGKGVTSRVGVLVTGGDVFIGGNVASPAGVGKTEAMTGVGVEMITNDGARVSTLSVGG